MNRYILILNGNNKDLAIEEFKILYKIYFKEDIEIKPIENVLYLIETNFDLKNDEFLYRLTYTNYIVKILGDFSDIDDLKSNFPNITEFQDLSFRVRIKKSKKNLKVNFEEKSLAKPIWDNLDNPKVSIKDYEIEYNFVFAEKLSGFFFGFKLYENQKEYLLRMPKMRPVVMPYTLKSDMARAVINLLKLKKGVVLDPFCGIGGILLEACDLGFDIIGNDISYNDLKYFKTNFNHYFPNCNYQRILADSQTQFLKNNSVDGIVSDIPYGRCSRKLGSDLYENFLKNAKNMLKPNKRIVIVYANFCEFKDLALKYFDFVCEVEEYINSTMTRHILVLENKK